MVKSPYYKLGVILIVSGAVLAPVFYLILDSVPLAALGISMITLGLVSAMLASSRPPITPEASQMMLLSGIQNLAALLEELGLRNRAIYMPAEGAGRPRALIPLSDDNINHIEAQTFPERLIARYGSNPEDIGLLVTTPGSVSLDGVGVEPGGGYAQIDGVLSQIIVGTMDLADSISSNLFTDKLVVEIKKPRFKYQNIWFYRCLGSPLASIVASVASQALLKPVRITNEEETKKGLKVELEIME